MSPKMHPTTIRLTENDQAFLASLQVDGASTVSDKIRSLIEERRLQQQAGRDYKAALSLASNLIGPVHDAIKLAENEQRIYSQFVRRVVEWTPELLATLLADGVAAGEQQLDKRRLQHLEQVLAEQVVRLMDVMLQTCVARDTALYAPESFSSEKLKPLWRICRLAIEDDKDNNL